MQPTQIALITDPGHPGLRPDDLGLPAAFEGEGVLAAPVPWGSPVPSDRFAAAVIRTPWDYFERHAAFLDWAEGLDVPLLNPASVLRWNHHKGYLVELQDLGLAKLPKTRLLAEGERPTDGSALLESIGAQRAVLKPAVSGGAFQTFVVEAGVEIPWAPEMRGEFLLQAFVDEIQGDGAGQGEWSLVFFGGEFSHALRKVAKPGDFRVQAEHGGRVLFETPPASLVVDAAEVLGGTVRHLGLLEPLAYARVDMVLTGGGDSLLMELELIEPELFFGADPGSPARFARSVLAGVQGPAV